ncbi:hypothetical protein KFL_004360060 [Klebsormidium nitens]|uniref:Centrosomal protein of 44 kDa n=1 Tax=Klebsormidium nitens TaxID=105231 RepID=A0A1Y1IC33_KLENI|nr:hypothetical protein KFL_004360060 [Klebsormidium nitens]|eukprot:GAQ88524.1 hypothetical protein KFL_004360060 [Klebsormidium nitens]
MATGDVQGNVDRLRLELRSVRYNEEIDVQGLRDGNPAAFLPLLHYCFLGYSRLLARHLSGLGHELYAKSDLRFVESVFKILRDEFAYRSTLTIAQFLSRGFAERKLILLYDIVQFCKRKHNELWKESQPAKVLKVHKTPPAEEREANVRVVRETPPAPPASTSNQATSSGRDATARNGTSEPGADIGTTSKVAALAARFRSPTEPPPLPQALQKQRRRVSHPTNNPPPAVASSSRPHNPMLRPQTATPSDHRPMPQAASARPQTSFADVNRVQIDASSRPMSEILRHSGGVASGADRPPLPEDDRTRAERIAESGGPSERRVQWADRENSLVDNLDANDFSDGDADRKEMSGVEPEQLLAALQRQLDASGNLVDAGRRFGQDDVGRASFSSDEDGPLSSRRLQEFAAKNEEQVEELRSTVRSLEEKYDKMEQEAVKVKENLQARITLLEGRIRFLEAAQDKKGKGALTAASPQRAGPSTASTSYTGRFLGASPVRQTSLPKRATSQGQPAAVIPQRSIRDVTNTESVPPAQVHGPKTVETSPIKANRGTKDFIEKMRARFEATQKLLQESDGLAA